MFSCCQIHTAESQRYAYKLIRRYWIVWWNISELISGYATDPWLLVSSWAWLYSLHAVPCSSVPCSASVGFLRVPQFPSTFKWCEYTCTMSCNRLVSHSKYFPSSPPVFLGSTGNHAHPEKDKVFMEFLWCWKKWCHLKMVAACVWYIFLLQ